MIKNNGKVLEIKLYFKILLSLKQRHSYGDSKIFNHYLILFKYIPF